MNSYLFLIFIHVLGAAAMFAAWAAESMTILQLRRATSVDEAQSFMRLLKKQRHWGPVAMLVVLATGIWMGISLWGHQHWMATAFAAMILIAIVGVALSRRTMPRLKEILADKPGYLPGDFSAATVPLVASLQVRISIGVGIVALMTMKPGLAGSLLILSIAIGMGIILAVRSTLRKATERMQEARSGKETA